MAGCRQRSLTELITLWPGEAGERRKAGGEGYTKVYWVIRQPIVKREKRPEHVLLVNDFSQA